ncbi:MAG: iron-containing alcohol dehydrogenase, partial [Rhodocyclaceae bacterium]|nr:iron-containing alcohol dehydrogenase [Rhodocyclaceae bacterium]
KGKSTDWMVHMIGQAIGGATNATHGMTLSAVSIPYYRHVMPHGQAKFRRYAVNVWDVPAEGKTDEQIASEGLARMAAWMREIGVAMNSRELGVTEDMLPGIVNNTVMLPGGYKQLSAADVEAIIRASME